VDNFFSEFFFNDFNDLTLESRISSVFRDFGNRWALKECGPRITHLARPASADRWRQHYVYSDGGCDAVLSGFSALLLYFVVTRAFFRITAMHLGEFWGTSGKA